MADLIDEPEKTTAELQAEGCTVAHIDLPPNICDGCNVRDGWEHRCHGMQATVRGEPTGRPCECHECMDEKVICASLLNLEPEARVKPLEALNRIIRRAIGLEEKQQPAFMQPVRDPKTSVCCTCGYAWPTGTHGGHSCSDVLFKKLHAALGVLNSIDKICDQYVASKPGNPTLGRVLTMVHGLKLSRDTWEKKCHEITRKMAALETDYNATRVEYEAVRAKFQAIAHGLRGDEIDLQEGQHGWSIEFHNLMVFMQERQKLDGEAKKLRENAVFWWRNCRKLQDKDPNIEIMVDDLMQEVHLSITEVERMNEVYHRERQEIRSLFLEHLQSEGCVTLLDGIKQHLAALRDLKLIDALVMISEASHEDVTALGWDAYARRGPDAT